jgi:hypothetical protein
MHDNARTTAGHSLHITGSFTSPVPQKWMKWWISALSLNQEPFFFIFAQHNEACGPLILSKRMSLCRDMMLLYILTVNVYLIKINCRYFLTHHCIFQYTRQKVLNWVLTNILSNLICSQFPQAIKFWSRETPQLARLHLHECSPGTLRDTSGSQATPTWVFSWYFRETPQSKSKLLYDWQSVSQSVCLGIKHPCGTCDQILFPVGMLLSEICGLVSIGHPLWWEDGSAICSVITQ